jgi:hypothetical protein
LTNEVEIIDIVESTSLPVAPAREETVLRAATPRKRRIERRLLALAAGLVVALLAGEGALRFLLFSDASLARKLGQRWRRMDLYTDSMDADYWKLQVLFNRGLVSAPPSPDPVVGWTGLVTPRTYGHPDEKTLAGRTPVLFFGDSNAECRTGPEDCFQGLMERSEFAGQYALLNYGVGGYGLDQIQRLLAASLDHYAAQDPVVIVSFMVDDDLERSMLPFRCWPKPRYGVKDGQLVDPPPVDTDTRHYLEENPPQITSYLYRLARSPFRRFEPERVAPGPELQERRELNRAVLERIRDDLEKRHLRYFFLVFQMESFWGGSKIAQWSEEVFDEFAAAHHVPYVATKPFMEAATASRPDGIGELIGRNDPVLQNHLNPAGNRLVFEAIRQGLEGRFDDFDLDRVRKQAKEGLYRREHNLARVMKVLGFSAGSDAKSEFPCVRYKEPSPGNPSPRLAMRCGDDGRTRVEIDIDGKCRRVRARVRAVGAGEKACEQGKLVFSARADANRWTSQTFLIGEAPREWVVETAGAKRLEMRLEYTGDDPACPWLLMDELRSE